MRTEVKQVAYGMATMLPGLGPGLVRTRRSIRGGEGGGAKSARYCYSAWLRHLIHAARNGLNRQPEIVVELGPGDSLGMGLAALLSGAARYWAVDAVRFVNPRKNLAIFDDLVELFRQRAALPGGAEFPELNPPVASSDFPADLLDESRLRAALDPNRLALIRNAILNLEHEGDSVILYKAPWASGDFGAGPAADMIYSQAVLEHIDNLPDTYREMNRWLKPGGFVSHEIDFKSHGLAARWDGHRAYSDLTWRLLRGHRPYLINRAPLSTHLSLLRENGFDLRGRLTSEAEPSVARRQLAARFRALSEEDRITTRAFLQAVKPVETTAGRGRAAGGAQRGGG